MVRSLAMDRSVLLKSLERMPHHTQQLETPDSVALVGTRCLDLQGLRRIGSVKKRWAKSEYSPDAMANCQTKYTSAK
jgi:hypothetical protein